jgi:hypothetical protein
MTYRVITDADHALSLPIYREAYGSILVKWMGEMVEGALRDARQRDAEAAHAARREASPSKAEKQRGKAIKRQRARLARRMVSDLKNFLMGSRGAANNAKTENPPR